MFAFVNRLNFIYFVIGSNNNKKFNVLDLDLQVDDKIYSNYVTLKEKMLPSNKLKNKYWVVLNVYFFKTVKEQY